MGAIWPYKYTKIWHFDFESSFNTRNSDAPEYTKCTQHRSDTTNYKYNGEMGKFYSTMQILNRKKNPLWCLVTVFADKKVSASLTKLRQYACPRYTGRKGVYITLLSISYETNHTLKPGKKLGVKVFDSSIHCGLYAYFLVYSYLPYNCESLKAKTSTERIKFKGKRENYSQTQSLQLCSWSFQSDKTSPCPTGSELNGRTAFPSQTGHSMEALLWSHWAISKFPYSSHTQNLWCSL